MLRISSLLPLVPVVPFALAASLAQTPPDIRGIYTGTYICNQRQFGLQLTFESRGATQISAVVTFFTPGGDAAQPLGAFRADGTFDPPTVAFRLQPMSWIKPAQTFMMFPFSGTYDAAAGRIKGTIQAPGCAAFEAVRDEQASRRATVEADARDAQLANAPTSLAQAQGEAQQCLTIGKWYSRFKKEYSGTDILRTMADDLNKRAINLLMDEEFSPVFGKPFEKMADPEREKIMLLLRQCGQLTGDQGDRYMYGTALGGAFRGTIFSADVVAQLAYRRTLRHQRQQLLKELPALPATDASLERVITLRDSDLKNYELLWPSEHRDLSDAVESATARIATPVVEAWVDKVIAGASGYDGLAAVTTARSRLSASAARPAPATAGGAMAGVPMPAGQPMPAGRPMPGARPMPAGRPMPGVPAAGATSAGATASGPSDTYVALATPVARTRADSKLNAKAQALVADLAAQERAKLPGLGTGLQALEAGTVWYHRVTSSLAGFQSEPAVQQAIAALEERRKQDLAAGASAVLARVNQAQTALQVKAVTAAYFGVPSDRLDPTAAPVFAAAATRERALATAAERAAEEARSVTNFCKTVNANDVTPGSGEPSSRDICMALAGYFDAVNDTVRSRGAACRGGDFRANPILALQCIQLCAASSSCEMSMGLTRVQKIACQKSASQPGFFCDYVAGYTSSNAYVGDMLSVIGGNGSLTKGRFVRTEAGWLKVLR